jgi:glycosyltransferase involved in cell wall biosynthesis
MSGEVALDVCKRLCVEFVAKLGPGEDPAHCLAGWGGFMLSPQPTAVQKESLLGVLCNRGRIWLRRRLTVLDEKNALREIRRRTAAVQQTLSAVDVLIAPSHFLRDRFIEFGVAADKILYLDNGFDLTPFGAFPVRSRAHERVVFAYVGTLVEHKGVHILIEAFNRLSPTAAALRVYGNLEVFPAYTARLRALATHPGISFAGGFANRDIGRILAEVDALIVPSLWFENSPLTIHEALLAGVPVIASNIGGMAEYVTDGKTGLLFEVGDVDDLYDKINWFCHHRQAFTTMPRPVYSSIIDHTRELVRIYTNLHQQRQYGS